MTNKTEILTFLSDNKDQLFSEYQLVKIGLFGSFSKNEETKDSDIDLIVEFEPNTKNLSEKKYKIRSLINNKFNRKVDLCREKYIKPYFKSQILKSVIYV
ncbi:MAG: nucleotidyltransferase family protein [Polaribacter sp.]